MEKRRDKHNRDEERNSSFFNGEPNSKVSSADYIPEEKSLEIWQQAGDVFSYINSDPDLAWEKLSRKISLEEQNLRSGRKVLMRVLSYAAAVILIAGLGFSGYLVTHRFASKQPATVSTQTSAHPDYLSTIILDDGSEITLNAGTSLEYPEKFGRHERRVKLEGEAFFSVVKDAEKPFVIEVKGAEIEVLGTSFNVRAYSGADKIEVNVKTGKVRLKSVLSGEEEILPAGNYGSVNTTTGLTETSKGLEPNYLAWLTREMEFDNTPLIEVFKVLENTYHVTISSESADIDSLPTSISFSRHNLDHVITVIAKMHSLEARKTDKGYIFEKR